LSVRNKVKADPQINKLVRPQQSEGGSANPQFKQFKQINKLVRPKQSEVGSEDPYYMFHFLSFAIAPGFNPGLKLLPYFWVLTHYRQFFYPSAFLYDEIV